MRYVAIFACPVSYNGFRFFPFVTPSVTGLVWLWAALRPRSFPALLTSLSLPQFNTTVQLKVFPEAFSDPL